MSENSEQVNVLVIGGGGREHAICWKLSQSARVACVYVAPGSHGIARQRKTKTVELDLKNFQTVGTWCKNNEIALVVVGPEDPLAAGIADALHTYGVRVFGPTEAAARIEADKDWAKTFMDRHRVPTARWQSFDDAHAAKLFINTAPFPALVVKATGLSAGKGVIVAANRDEACTAVDSILTQRQFGAAGGRVVIEELLTGEEVSVLAFADGTCVRAMLPAQDHKRIGDGDTGPNTGGMGAYCPCPLLDGDAMTYVQEAILQRTIDGLRAEGTPFVGVLYAGLMLTPDGPKVLEFNCRFGDPETEVILPLLQSDLYDIMDACCEGRLKDVAIEYRAGVSAVGVVMASRGYPAGSSKGQVITGVNTVTQERDCIVFHCGTASQDVDLVTNGGRVLIAVAIARQLAVAAGRATAACSVIRFDGEQHRTDIAHKGIVKAILHGGQLTYKSAGVDITAGNDFVDHIKPCAKSTWRAGVMGNVGGFGALFDLKMTQFKDPLLVSGTDGVGTKLQIAKALNMHQTIGIDLVAMCVNDVVAHGAEPLYFLDYYACGVLDVGVAKQVISGIAEGCRQAGCALVGGETAEMPGMYPAGEYDLAGFAVGAVERSNLLPRVESINCGDVVIALPSSGVHSNGFSLVRRAMQLANIDYCAPVPFNAVGKSIGEELLTPTRIYVRAVAPAIRSGKVKAFAHITGGGLTENIPRVLRDDIAVDLDASAWHIPAVFPWLATLGGVSAEEMLRTFNCGVGAVLIVSAADASEMLTLMQSAGASVVGTVVQRATNEPQVRVRHFVEAMMPMMRAYVPNVVRLHADFKKRVAVLISGSGTNLQALIDATMNPVECMAAEIVLVISNKADVEGLKRAERAGIPTMIFTLKEYDGSREECDMAMHSALVKADVDIVCLAGFMRILSEKFTRLWHAKMINLHPALLPLFKGTHAVQQALDAGVRVTGCTIHFVEPDVDSGAIIIQEGVPIEVGDTETSLSKRLRPAEHRAYIEALRLLATGRVRLDADGKIVWS